MNTKGREDKVEQQDAPAKPVEKMNKKELRAEANRLGHNATGKETNRQLIDMIKAAGPQQLDQLPGIAVFKVPTKGQDGTITGWKPVVQPINGAEIDQAHGLLKLGLKALDEQLGLN